MFERLQLLSAGLENLPKVTPSYSLVDAILPRLAELQANGPAAGPETAPIIEEVQGPAAGRTGRNVPQRRWNRFSLGALGGVVAAGIAFGLFLANYQSGDPLRAGGSANTAASDAATGSADGAATSAAQESTADRNMPKDGNEVRIGSAKTDAKPLAKNSAAGNDTTFQVENNKGEAAAHDEPATASPSQDSIPNADQYQSPNYSSTGSGEAPKTDAADSGKQAEEPAAPADKSPGYGIAGAPVTASQEWVSPDGRYKAAFVDSRLKVYEITDGTMPFESPKWPSGITAVVWAPDSKSLTYETKSEDGRTVVYKVDPANGTEELQTK
jgi:hypothetical protein